MPNDIEIVKKMGRQAREWDNRKDKRAIFLRCYTMMTANMVGALESKRFRDQEWVNRLLHRFADYYFDALACFDCGENVPKVWRVVHEAAAEKNLHVVQHLFLGVNAHINYDLVLTLYELLKGEWDTLSEEERKGRYQDHCMVNTIIAETIDQVQDEVVEEYAPSMDIIDKVMGRLDEKLFVGLISRWRESVWEHTLLLLSSTDEQEQHKLIRQLEQKVLKHAKWLEGRFW